MFFPWLAYNGSTLYSGNKCPCQKFTLEFMYLLQKLISDKCSTTYTDIYK